jgi:class 3 adenylate cyclase/CheY-like chemotaxis protein
MQDEKLSILYVDDEEQNLISFKAAFRRHYSIFTANSGKAGLEILQNQKVSLIITDQRMPEMTGVQFLEKVIPVYPDTIRMILTGFSDIEVIIDAINTGRVFRYITKPWDTNELKMTIDNACQLFRLQKNNKELLHELQLKVNEQEKTLKLFQKYVPEEVVKKALNSTEESIFEGETMEVTVLFCDIRGFTTISEQITPKEVVALLNAYYGIMTESIKNHNGTVNQFVGDEIFACFGAPVSHANNEQNAVFCAIEMIKRLEKLNKQFYDKLGQKIEVGIGINAGEVVVGNTGSEDHIGFSITGDTVNTGKRIETLTKDNPDTILISEPVCGKVNHLFEVKTWEPVSLKGKRDKIQVYEVLGVK